jgi:hypothetical protein
MKKLDQLIWSNIIEYLIDMKDESDSILLSFK